MTDCCNTTKTTNKSTCPHCHSQGTSISINTMLHHLFNPWEIPLTVDTYYFCATENCDVVYFGLNNQVIQRNQLRHAVTQKDPSPQTLVCYCFGVTRAQAHANSAIKDFVTEQTKNGLCACTTHNPAGKCCLKHFPATP